MQIKKFLARLLLFSIPFILMVVTYIYLDPFKVVWNYPAYYDTAGSNNISLNKDYVSTENWKKYYSQYKYDSYIFGSSRSIYYEIDTWKELIGADYKSCYHFDAYGESLYGIAKKFEFLESRNIPIKNALIVLDGEILGQTENSGGHLFIKHPLLSGQHPFMFQVECFKSFFDFKFLTSYLDFKITGKVKEYMKKEFMIVDRSPIHYDPVTNELRQKSYEEMITKNKEGFYEPRKAVFYERKARDSIAMRIIQEGQRELLLSIKRVLDKNNSNYRIVISPLYDQVKFNPDDLGALQEIFGHNQVFDFSGVNEFTASKYNYYETSHYRPHVANEIMKKVYAGQLSQR
ncbi:MAG: hypothetical protein ACXWB9_00705 [Flavisolibacter sp.]